MIRARRRRGYTLIEVVVVLTIMGVLLTISAPSFHRALEESRADAATAALRSIWSAERLYWLEYRTYTSDMTALAGLGLVDPSLVAGTTFYA
jgi:prepilin-type N-terminal cleavage/methylation domain-containing protein